MKLLTPAEARRLRARLHATVRRLGFPRPRTALERLRESLDEGMTPDRAWEDLDEPGCRRKRRAPSR